MSANLRVYPSNLLRFSVAMVLAATCSTQVLAQNGTWNTTDGFWDVSGDWVGNTPANGADNTATFSIDADAAANFTATGFARNGIGIQSDRTIGNLSFADSNLATPGGYELYSSTEDDPLTTEVDESEILTLAGTAPTITVAPLGPIDSATVGETPGQVIDDALVRSRLAGTSGFTKAGDGVLTIAGNSSALTGAINVNAGTLRYASGSTYAGATAPITLANGTALEHLGSNAFFGNVKLSSGAAATLRMLGGGSNFLNAVQGQGTGETLNAEFGVSGATYSLEGDWATGGLAVVNFKGLDAAGASNIRARINRPAPNNFNPNAFQNTKLNLDNVSLLFQTNSFGNNVLIGELSGTSTALLTGGNNGSGGSAPRYIIGGLNTDSTFAGTINGAGGPVSPGTGGMSIEKVGTGTLTLSGSFSTTMVGSNGDIGRQGGVVRVSAGTLALTNTANNIPGGYDTFKTTVDVLPGATFDVSGTNTAFTSSPLQQFQGSGTIVGPFNHVAGELRPADVSTVDNDTSLTNLPVPTVGTINFNGGLSFNGGTIVYDMNATPGVNDLIAVTGSTDLGTGGTIQPNFLGADPAVGLTYTVLNSSAGFTGNTAGWSVAWPGRGAKPAVVTNGNLLQFTTTAIGTVGDIVWSGAVSGDWDIEGTQNWTNGGSPDVYFEGDNVRFDDTGANPAINVTVPVAPSSMVVDSSTNNYAFTGNAITSSGTLTKRGTSTLTLGTTNAFVGGAFLEGGTVDVGAVNNAMGAGPLTMSGAAITSTGGQIGNNGLAVTVATTNSIQIDGGGGSGGAFNIPVLSGDGDLTISSATEDKWFASGVTSAFTGTLTVGPNNGAVQLGNWRGRGGQTSFPNAAVTLDSVVFTNQQGGSGEVTFAFGELHGNSGAGLHGFVGGSGAPNANWEIGNLNTDSDFAGVIDDGTGGGGTIAVSRVTKVGTGTLTLTGVNSYTGDTTVDGGTLSINNSYLNDLADVYVASGALFNLDFAGADVIDSLYLGGAPQAVGTYGAIGNASATFQTPFLTGSGILDVTTLGVTLGLPGDFNQDNVVDAADYTVWRDNLSGATALPNDNGLGVPIAAAHYDLWRANYGATATPAPLGASTAAAAPEPTSLCLLLLAGLAAARRRAPR